MFWAVEDLHRWDLQEFRKFLDAHFDLRGIEIEPRNDVANKLHHDGMFARAFIKYSKGSRNNSGFV